MKACIEKLHMNDDDFMTRVAHYLSFARGIHWYNPHTKVAWYGVVFFLVCLNNLLDKQSSCLWYKTPWRSCVIRAMAYGSIFRYFEIFRITWQIMNKYTCMLVLTKPRPGDAYIYIYIHVYIYKYTGTGEFPAQRPVTRKMFPFDDVIMGCGRLDDPVRLDYVYIVEYLQRSDEMFHRLSIKSAQCYYDTIVVWGVCKLFKVLYPLHWSIMVIFYSNVVVNAAD